MLLSMLVLSFASLIARINLFRLIINMGIISSCMYWANKYYLKNWNRSEYKIAEEEEFYVIQNSQLLSIFIENDSLSFPELQCYNHGHKLVKNISLSSF